MNLPSQYKKPNDLFRAIQDLQNRIGKLETTNTKQNKTLNSRVSSGNAQVPDQRVQVLIPWRLNKHETVPTGEQWATMDLYLEEFGELDLFGDLNLMRE